MVSYYATGADALGQLQGICPGWLWGSAAASGFPFSSAFSRNLSTSVASCILRSIISSVRNSDFLQLNFHALLHCFYNILACIGFRC